MFNTIVSVANMALIHFRSHRCSHHRFSSSCLPYCKELLYSA